MRLRNWLLTGTSLAALAMLPGTAIAQQSELQALQEAQASGDADAISAAEQALREACIVNGYGSVDECIAAITGGGAPAPAADPQADADAEAAARAEAEAAAAAQAEADAAAAAQAEADAQAAAAAQAEADAQAAAAAQAEADAAAAAQAEADAQAAAAAQAEADAKAQAEAEAAARAEAEAAAAAAAQEQQAPAEEPAPAPAEEPAPAPAEEPAPAPVEEPAPAAEQPSGPSAEEQQAQFVADLQSALDAYQAALNQAAAGDYAGAVPAAQAAEARILELCTANGYPDIASCIGQELPPLPEPPTDAPAADAPATAPEAPAPDAPAAEQPAEVGPTDEPADAGVTDPVAAAQDQLGTAVELYNVGIGQLQGGDPAGQSTIDAANRQFADICAQLGNGDVAACLQQYGITLPPVPELAAPAEAAPPPIADLPGSDVDVTPDAVEILATPVAPEEAAPLLDSAKDFRIARDNGQAPAEPAPAPTEPPPPPPTDDRSAQSDIAAIQVVSPSQETGEQITFDQLGPVEVPQNVTIINNVTNVTNITNNTTTNIDNSTTNNNGGQGGGNNQGGPRPGQPGFGGGGNNYTNSGFIFNIGVNLVISNPAQDFDRIREDDDDIYYERLPGGRVKETIERPNGVQIVTIRDRWGNVLKRSRIMPDGREYILAYYDEDDYEDEDYFNNWRDPGDDLPPLRLNIPIRDYIIDADYSDEDDVEEFFRQPPVEQVRKIYTVEDVKRSARLRDSVRRIEVGSLSFDSGAATISRTQVGALSKVANAMLALLEDNPGEVFLIEGHTDAVGSDQSNLVLSDARAATVARILTDFYDVPPENLVTQGYGERYLKVNTQLASPENRRVAVKRITPLITVAGRD